MADTAIERSALGDSLAIGSALLFTAIGSAFCDFRQRLPINIHGVMLAVARCLGAHLHCHTSDGSRGRPGEGYMDGPVRVATIACVFWGIVGFLVGDILAWQLAFPALNFDLPWTSFGRLRPVHTSAVIFAFGGNALIATSLYVVQRTSRARLAGKWAPWFVVWGYQLFIVLAASSYVLGVTQAKEYAEPEWYVDIWSDHRLGRLSARVPRNAVEARRAAHLCRQLVLSGVHRHGRDAAFGQQSDGAGVVARQSELLAVCRCARRHDAMVVWP